MTMLPPYPKSLSVTTILAMRTLALEFQAKAKQAAEMLEYQEEADALLEVADEFSQLAARLDEAADHAGALEDYLDVQYTTGDDE